MSTMSQIPTSSIDGILVLPGESELPFLSKKDGFFHWKPAITQGFSISIKIVNLKIHTNIPTPRIYALESHTNSDFVLKTNNYLTFPNGKTGMLYFIRLRC